MRPGPAPTRAVSSTRSPTRPEPPDWCGAGGNVCPKHMRPRMSRAVGAGRARARGIPPALGHRATSMAHMHICSHTCTCACPHTCACMYMHMREYIQRIRHARAHARVYTGIAAACSDCSACSDQPATTAASCAPERELPRINTEVRYGGITRDKPGQAERPTREILSLYEYLYQA